MITETQYKQALSVIRQWRREQIANHLTTMPVGAKFCLERDVNVRHIPNSNNLVAEITKLENDQYSIISPNAIDAMTMTHQMLFDRLNRAINRGEE